MKHMLQNNIFPIVYERVLSQKYTHKVKIIIKRSTYKTINIKRYSDTWEAKL